MSASSAQTQTVVGRRDHRHLCDRGRRRRWRRQRQRTAVGRLPAHEQPGRHAAAPHHRRPPRRLRQLPGPELALRFDTSPLPDNATVSSVKLRGYLTSVADDDDRTLIGEWYSAANWPIDPSDWTLTPPPPPSPAPTSPA